MKSFKLIFSLIFVANLLHAQGPDLPIYGIVRQNFYTTTTDPLDSTWTFQTFDSAKIYLGEANPATGNIKRIGNTSYNNAINLTGSSLNPYNNTFVFMGGLGFNVFDLNTGIMTDEVPIDNPNGQSYFDNFRFNNSDSTIYGLARRSEYDPVTGLFDGSVLLAKANPQTGLVTEISPSSVAWGFSLSGSAIDPYQMVYYFAIGNQLMGLDLYDGSVYSDVPIQVDGPDSYFGNFTYSCADTALYGLASKLYYSTVPDPSFPGSTMQKLDSATLKLARVDPNTGLLTVISPVSLPYNAYSLNAGTAIDPFTMTYYFGGGYDFVGVSLITGLITSIAPYNFDQGGTYFDMMRGYDNCINAATLRAKPAVSAVGDLKTADQFVISPNPASEMVTILSEFAIQELSVFSVDGRVVCRQEINGNQATVDMSKFAKGVYIFQLKAPDKQVFYNKVVKN